jgi:hypothetical protein
MPISEVLLRGSAPNNFMSRAESHEVGGGKPDKEEGGEGGGGLEDRVWKDRGAREGVGEGLSLIICKGELDKPESDGHRLWAGLGKFPLCSAPRPPIHSSFLLILPLHILFHHSYLPRSPYCAYSVAM